MRVCDGKIEDAVTCARPVEVRITGAGWPRDCKRDHIAGIQDVDRYGFAVAGCDGRSDGSSDYHWSIYSSPYRWTPCSRGMNAEAPKTTKAPTFTSRQPGLLSKGFLHPVTLLCRSRKKRRLASV